MKLHHLLLLFCILYLSNCKQKQTPKEKQQQIETGSLNEKNEYTSAEVGWTVNIPKDWSVLTKKERDKLNEKGMKAIEENNNIKVDATGLKELINLKKDLFNSFISTIEPYSEKETGTYDENNKKIIDIIKQTYAGKGMKAEYDEGKEKIDGLEFYTFFTRIYSPDKSKIILYQKMYSRLINGYDLGITMTYNNEEDKKTLEDVVKSSKFSLRN